MNYELRIKSAHALKNQNTQSSQNTQNTPITPIIYKFTNFQIFKLYTYGRREKTTVCGQVESIAVGDGED